METISCFPLKNSKINIIQEKSSKPIYPIYPLIWTKRERIYIPQNIAKLIRAYTMGRGKTGIVALYGTGVNGWVYFISIPKKVSLPYTCPQSKAPI